MSKTFYITTPIYYVNDVPHIGHAYTTIAADVLARYYRLLGHDVFFLTGLDEHGQKVQQAAQKAGIDPKTYCDQLAPKFKNLWKQLNISNDAFIRTTDPEHIAFVRKKLQFLKDPQHDEIYLADYVGWYCVFDERFWTEKDVVEGLCPDCKRPVERLTEPNYFFKMSAAQDALIEYIKSSHGYPEKIRIRPESRRNEVLGFLTSQRLGDLCISRHKSRLSWGIDIPFDSNYVTYVWFDALVNYISALEYLIKDKTKKYWPTRDDQNHEVIHLIGKDILTTHAVYWPTMLRALGLELPTMIFAHGWWTVNGEKMSKSRGNVVDPYALVDEFGADAFRYFLLREVPFGHDGDFSRAALIGRINTELANDLGNLLSRSIAMIERYAGGRVPKPERGAVTDLDRALQQTAERLKDAVGAHIGNLEFSHALESVWSLVKLGNQYIDRTAPWVLAKKPEDRARLDTVLYNAVETLRFLCLFLHPVMPKAAENIKQQLGLMLNFSKPLLSSDITWGGVPPGTEIARGQPLFPRIETTTSTQGEQPVNQDMPASPAPLPAAPAQITLEDFQKIQLKVARVLSAERVPKSEKLIKLQVDLGTEQRQVVAGIGKKYAPEELIGRRIVIVANLKPAKLMGVESQGMVLAAGDADVKELVTLMSDVDPGTKVK
jgi:methionyl-tRNA synthetase